MPQLLSVPQERNLKAVIGLTTTPRSVALLGNYATLRMCQGPERMSKSDRRLLTYAFVSQNIFDQNDVLFGLLPFFKPILQQTAGRIFDAQDFASRVRELYRWPVNPDVAEVLIPRFVKAGWLKRLAERQDVIAYVCQPPDLPAGYEAVEHEVTQTLAQITRSFVEFNGTFPSLLALTYDEADLQEMLLAWLVEKKAFDSKSILEALAGSSEGTIVSEPVKIAVRRADARRVYSREEEYLCARFVKHLSATQPALFESLAKIAAVALVTEVALDIRAPSASQRPREPLQVFLDAPFAMTLLGLSGRQRSETATYIFEHLKELNYAVSIFGHSCDEIRNNLRALFNTHPHDRYGPTADAMRMGDVAEPYAKAVQANVEHFVQQKGIAVVDYNPALFPNEHKYFPGELIQELANALPWDSQWSYDADKAVAKMRDAKSICYVMRRRRGRMSSDVFYSQCILVTQNMALCRVATDFLMQHDLLREGQMGPAIHQRYMAALLFLTLGSSEKAELSRRELLESCEAIVNASPEVIEGARKRLKEVRPQNAEQIEALLAQPRSVQLLLDLTLGSQTVAGQSDADVIYEALRQSTADEVRADANKRIKSVQEKARAEKKTLATALAEKDDNLRRLEQRMVEVQNRDATVVRGWVDDAVTMGRNIRRREKILFTALQALVIVLSAVLGASILSAIWGAIFGLVAGAIAALTTMFQLWDRLYIVSPERLKVKQRRYVEDLAAKARRLDLLKAHEITWDGSTMTLLQAAALLPATRGPTRKTVLSNGLEVARKLRAKPA